MCRSQPTERTSEGPRKYNRHTVPYPHPISNDDDPLQVTSHDQRDLNGRDASAVAVDGYDGRFGGYRFLKELEKIPLVVTSQLDGTAREWYEHRTTLSTPIVLPVSRTVLGLDRHTWNPL